MSATRNGAAFVPHDIAAPLKGAASGPLAGLTAAVKDMYDIAGERAGAGNPDFLAAQPPAKRNAPAVQKVVDAGATIIGKTICEEFFYSIAGSNAHYGAPNNPRAAGRLPGGSSSGSASAVAAAACDFALGSDTGGSVRIPASFCGIYGIRPTLGRIDHGGMIGMSPAFDVPGWFAATPGVFRNLGPVLLDDQRVRSQINRVLVLSDAFEQADQPVQTLCSAALSAMADDLPPQELTRIAPNGFDAWREIFRIIQAYETWQSFGGFIEKHRPALGPGIRERMEFASTVTAAQTIAPRHEHERARAHLRAVVTPGTVLALPTAPCVAPPIDLTGDAADAFRTRAMRLTVIAGMGGLPQISIPAGTASGLPVGLSFIGWPGGDEALLDLAYALAPHCGMAV